MRPIIEAIVDRGSFLELGAGWGRRVVTGLARLDGWPVGGPGGRSPSLRRRLDRRSRPQGGPVRRFRRYFPSPRHASGRPAGLRHRSPAEKEATIRHGARALAAIYQAQVPWCSVILRRALRRRGGRAPERLAPQMAVRVAVGRLGVPADRGRRRGCLQGPDRSRAGSRSRTGPDRSAPGPGSIAVPNRRALPDRGDRRPARHPAAAGRVRQSRGAPAPARPAPLGLSAVKARRSRHRPISAERRHVLCRTLSDLCGRAAPHPAASGGEGADARGAGDGERRGGD